VSLVVKRPRNNTARSWNAYRAWLRACIRCAWRETRDHFSGGWRSVIEVLGPGFATTLALYLSGADADPARDHVATIAMGAAVSVLWIVAVFCWNVSLAPYRLWRAALARIAHLQTATGRIDHRQAIAQELELCIKKGTALMDSATPSKSQLSQWYERVLRVVSRAGNGDRAMLETLGPAPGTRGGPLELLILSNRIEKLRLILDRQNSGRERANIGPRRSAGALQRG
jgi:hypothetical protein